MDHTASIKNLENLKIKIFFIYKEEKLKTRKVTSQVLPDQNIKTAEFSR